LYKKLSTQSELGFFLQVDTAEKRKRLNNIYTQVAVDEKWPAGTRYSEVSEWTFTCRVQNPSDLSVYDACSFTYLDYAGGRLTEAADEEDGSSDFDDRFKAAEALLVLLDGQKLCALMKKEKIGIVWSINDLRNMIDVMQGSTKPVHFVISKWDVVEQSYTLEQIRDRLLEIDEFKNLVKFRNQAGSPVRLIPISAVGKGFAIAKPDGSMEKTGELPKPFQVEVPLACILPDMIKVMMDELIRKRNAELETPIKVKPDIGFFDFLGQLFADGMKTVQDLLPRKYRFASDSLERLIEWAETPAQQKIAFAARRTEELRREQEESLKKVANEETALSHAINCFVSIQNQLVYRFPSSEFKSTMTEIQAWRFLVSRNQFLDYRTVVAPDFMCEANIASLLAKAAEGDQTNDDCVYYREIHGSKVGDLTIIYRVMEAQARNLNPEIDGVLKDSFGREISFIEGLVIEGINTSISLTLEDLELNHQDLISDYRDFWEWVSPQPAIQSEMSILKCESVPLKLIQVSMYGISSLSSKPMKSTEDSSSKSEKLSSSNSFIFDGKIYFSKFIDDSRVLVHQYNKAILLIDLRNKDKEIEVLIKGNINRYINQIAFNIKSQLVCTANIASGDNNIVKIWDLNTSTERDIRENPRSELGRLNALAFSHDGEVVATDEKSRINSLVPINLVDTKVGGTRGEQLNLHESNVNCIESSPFDNIFASGDGKGFIRIWNWKSLSLIGSLPKHHSTVNAIAFSPSEKILVSGGDDGKIKIASYSSDLQKINDKGLLGEHSDCKGRVNTLAFSPDGKTVASGGDDGKVKLWNIKSKMQIKELSGHDKPVMSVGFSPNGKLLASGSKDKTVRIWQIN
jgi:WD40 repeat protein